MSYEHPESPGNSEDSERFPVLLTVAYVVAVLVGILGALALFNAVT